MVKALVIGELGTDRFVYCKITRLCPEAPVPVLNPVEIKENKGMAGNVVENLNALSNDIEVVHWHQSTKIEKTRFVEKKSNQMITRVDDGEIEKCDTLNFLSPRQKKTIDKSDFVIISDYNKGYLDSNIIDEISKLAKLTIMDTKKKLSGSMIMDIDFVKLNETEYQNNKELVDLYPEKFIITLGSEGCMYNHVVYPSSNPKETIDVSGAGDTFTASFILKYHETNDIPTSLKFANDMASIVVSKRGVATP
jgi:bifunctional ADP-heptose synthase (sugar kinase/adenylyltransferase)